MTRPLRRSQPKPEPGPDNEFQQIVASRASSRNPSVRDSGIFLWRLKAGESERLVPESMPLSRTDGFLLDDLDATICWNSLSGPGSGFGWDRRNGRVIKSLPRLPGLAKQELNVSSFVTVAFEQGGQPTGRIFLLNARNPFQKQDLPSLDTIPAYISPPLQTLFLLRHLRARAIEAERSRIARDLHDGLLQTLLSIEIQLAGL